VLAVVGPASASLPSMAAHPPLLGVLVLVVVLAQG
jgi:hypothetical protein